MNTRSLPMLIGVFATLAVSLLGGYTAALWFLFGVFVGGGVPLYLMPWVRRRSLR